MNQDRWGDVVCPKCSQKSLHIYILHENRLEGNTAQCADCGYAPKGDEKRQILEQFKSDLTLINYVPRRAPLRIDKNIKELADIDCMAEAEKHLIEANNFLLAEATKHGCPPRRMQILEGMSEGVRKMLVTLRGWM